MSEHAVAHQDHGPAGHDSHDDASHGGVGKYLLVFAALCALTTCSLLTQTDFWVHHVSKHASWALMMAVSCTKAMLVITFFMHLLWEANWKWVLTIPATFMSIFLTLMLIPDIGMRQNNGYAHYSEQRYLYAPDPPSIENKEMNEAKQELSHQGAH